LALNPLHHQRGLHDTPTMPTKPLPLLFWLLLLLLPVPCWAGDIVGFLVPASGLGDQSFNDMTYTGLIQARVRHRFTLIREQCRGGTEADRRQAMNLLIQRGADIIVVNGWQYRNLVRDYARRYPERRFLLHDFPMDGLANVVSTVFGQHEGSFLAGALAGWMSRSGRIGFIGGVDTPVIRAFQSGFRQGAQFARPDIVISEAFLSPATDPYTGFASPSLGFSTANRMFDSGVDIIFGAAGLSGQGIIQAARRQGKYVIGSEADQDHLAEGFVLTSVMKRLDMATVSILDRLLAGEPMYGIQHFGLKEGGVSLSPMTYTRGVIPQAVQEQLVQLQEKIIAAEIVVTDSLREQIDAEE